MSDLVLGPVIGKLGGGAEVHTIPVDFVSPSGEGVHHVADVPVPEGVTARVVVVGTSEVMTSRIAYWPRLIIGGQDIGLYHESVGGSATVTGPTVVEAERRFASSSADPSFVGTVYWWDEVPSDPGGGGDNGGGGDEVPSDPGEGGDNGGGGDEVVITGTSGTEARDSFRAALAERGLDYRTVETVPFLLDTSSVTNMRAMFEKCSSLTSVPDMDTSNVEGMVRMFNGCSSLTSVPDINTGNVTNMRGMFQKCSSLTSVPDMDTSNVEDMSYMFNGCAALTSVPDIDTGNVTTMRTMFQDCSSLSSVPDMDTSNVTTMSYMFCDCSALTDGNVRCIGKKYGVETVEMIDYSGLTRLPFYDTNGNWTG